MNTNYLQLDFKTGQLYQYSKNVEEGYVKYTSNTGKVSYRKYFRGIEGEFENIQIKETDRGQKLNMSLITGEDYRYVISFNLYDSRANVDRFAENLIVKLGNINKGDQLKVNPYNFIPEGSQYPLIGVSLKLDGSKIEKDLSYSYVNRDGELVNGDIPPIVWREDPITGKKQPSKASLEDKNIFLLTYLKKQLDRLGYKPNGHEVTEDIPEETKIVPKQDIRKDIKTTEVPKSTIKKPRKLPF